MKLSKSWTTVTPLSKTIALILFAILPALAFCLGTRYQQKLDQPLINRHTNATIIKEIITPTPVPINTSSWKVFVDPFSKISIKYPLQWNQYRNGSELFFKPNSLPANSGPAISIRPYLKKDSSITDNFIQGFFDSNGKTISHGKTSGFPSTTVKGFTNGNPQAIILISGETFWYEIQLVDPNYANYFDTIIDTVIIPR
ncbi:hypothetical protein BH09PAT1_BH09PAT1_2140 [soil metagenome]